MHEDHHTPETKLDDDAPAKAPFFRMLLQALIEKTGLDVLAALTQQRGSSPLDQKDLRSNLRLSKRGRRDALAITLLNTTGRLNDALQPYYDHSVDHASPEVVADLLVRWTLLPYYDNGHLPDYAEWNRNRQYQLYLCAIVHTYMSEVAHALAREHGNRPKRRATVAADDPGGFQAVYNRDMVTAEILRLDYERWITAAVDVEGQCNIVNAFRNLDEEATGFAVMAAMRCNGAREIGRDEFPSVLKAVAWNYARHD